MANIIGVRFQSGGKVCYYDPGETNPETGAYVIADTERGPDLGEVVSVMRDLDEQVNFTTCGQITRIATSQDMAHAQANRQAEQEAYVVCQKKIQDHRLDMKLVSVEYAFDNSKIMFYFTSNGRVDFRSLVKDLAGVFKTRIELRQIGVRDEAKMLGGLGPCGRPICCGAFLKDFQPVSIKMAKEQNLSLNPTKISGVCGRLMCCLKYEQDNYETIRKMMPKVGREVNTPDGTAVVTELNIIKETVQVRITKGDSFELKEFRLDEIAKAGETLPVRENTEKRDNAAEEPAGDPIATPDENEESPAASREEGEDPDVTVDLPASVVNKFPEVQSGAENRKQQRNGPRPRNNARHENERKPERNERKPRREEDQLGKPVQRENTNRKPGHNRNEQLRPRNNPRKQADSKPVSQSDAAPVQENKSNIRTAPQPAAEAKSTPVGGNKGWQEALQRAMAAAGQNTDQ